MTEPIAVDVAVKPAPSSKPAPAAKPTDAEKPSVPPVPVASPGGWLTKKQAMIAASAVFSMVAGVAAVRMVWPAAGEPAPMQVLAPDTKGDPKSGTAAPKSSTVEMIPPPGLPVIPTTPPAAGMLPPPTLTEMPSPAPLRPLPPTNPSAPNTPASGIPPVPPELPPIPTLPSGGSSADPAFRPASPPVSPLSPPVIPAGGQNPPKPPDMGLPPLPVPPAAGPAAPLPTPGGMTPAIPSPSMPAPPTGPGASVPLPPLPAGSGMVPPPIDLAPKTPPPPIDLSPKTPPTIDLAPKTPDPMNLAIPAAPKTGAIQGAPVNPPPIAPPATPPLAGMGGALPIPPVGPGGTGGAIPPPAELTGVGGTKLDFTKPPSSPTVTPVGGPDRTPTTSYDVDIHELKAGDTYESISREFYSDTRYAAALRAYNGNKPLQGIRSVDVPPIHIVKRFAQGQPATPAVRPVSGTGTPPPEWGPSGTQPPAPRPGGGTTFRVPQGGMSMRAVARWALGSEQRWTEIYDLNPQITKPDEILPQGTELKLPADARPPG